MTKLWQRFKSARAKVYREVNDDSPLWLKTGWGQLALAAVRVIKGGGN